MSLKRRVWKRLFFARASLAVRLRFWRARLLGFPMDASIQRSPMRSPAAVSEALRDLLADKVVCEFGCAEGDNLFFMGRYAKRAFGVELSEKRGRFARMRGLDVIQADWGEIPVPEADVYYFWPDHSAHCLFLVDRIVNQRERGEIIAAGDTGWASDPPIVQHCAKLGRIVTVPFDEGRGWRQSGEFLLAIIDIAEAKRIRARETWTPQLPA